MAVIKKFEAILTVITTDAFLKGPSEVICTAMLLEQFGLPAETETAGKTLNG